jgi:hypothetical protein
VGLRVVARRPHLEVDDEQQRALAVAARALDLAGELLLEASAVGQAGARVAVGELAQLTVQQAGLAEVGQRRHDGARGAPAAQGACGHARPHDAPAAPPDAERRGSARRAGGQRPAPRVVLERHGRQSSSTSPGSPPGPSAVSRSARRSPSRTSALGLHSCARPPASWSTTASSTASMSSRGGAPLPGSLPALELGDQPVERGA